MKPLTPNSPHVIIMVGIPGSGKTTFAEHFAKTFQAPYINPRDVSVLTGIDSKATEKVTNLLFDQLLKTKQTLIYEGSTSLRSQRSALEKKVVSIGYTALFVWVQTDPVESRHRATKKQKTKTLNSAEFDQALQRFQNPVEAEKAVVISGKHTYATQLKAVLRRTALPRSQQPVPTAQPRIVPGRNIIVR